MQACNGHQYSNQSADNANVAKSDTANKDPSVAVVNNVEAKFAVAVANGGVAEIVLGKLTNVSNMIDDHKTTSRV